MSALPAAGKLWHPYLLGAGYFLFALATLSRQYTFDAISYLLDVERTRLSFPIHAENIAYNFFHSQHLLFSFTIYCFYHAWMLLGYQGSALLPAQFLNLCEGSVTIGLTFAAMRMLTGDGALSFLCCLLLGFSFAFWDNTAMVSDHMASCLIAVLFFRCLLDTSIAAATTGRLALLGFLNGLGFLMHQVNGLLGVLFIAAMVAEHGRLKSLATYIIAAALTAGVPYVVVGVWILGNSSIHDFVFWSFYYAMPGVIDVAGRYGTVGFGKIADLLTGFGASVVGGFYWMNRIFETRFLQRQLVPALALASAAAFAFIVVKSRTTGTGDTRSRIERLSLLLSAAWFLSYALLLYWWWPAYYQLWVVPLTGLALFGATGLHGRFRAEIVRYPSLLRALILLLAFVGSANAISAFGPSHDPQNNDYYVTTVEIGKLTHAGDMIVIPGDDEYEVYIPYFIKRDVASLHALLVEHENDFAAAFEDIQSHMDSVWEQGHDIFIVSELRDTVSAYRDLYELHHLSNEEVARRFRSYQVQKSVETRGITLYRLRRPDHPD
jgi:hypothetical protein